MPVLSARGLVKTFSKHGTDVEVLRGVDVDLDEGDAVAVVGPSGAGKSTLLNLLGGLDQPDAGEIHHGDTTLPTRSLAELTLWRRHVVGFVFQYHFLLPDFTARENLLLPVRLLHDPTGDDRDRADELLAAMDLTDRADHRPGELSGGEQQRVAVARAFMNHPRVVLADEPFGNLDRAKGSRLGELLFSLRDRERVSLVIVTHDPELARRAGRVMELKDGLLKPLEEVTE